MQGSHPVAPDQHSTSALDQQSTQIDVASLGDAELWVVVPGLAASRPQTEITAHIPASLEAFLAAQCQNIGQRCELANAVHLEQCLRLRILRLGELLDGTVSAATRRNSHRRRLGCATAPTTSLMQDASPIDADRDWRFSGVH